MGDVLKFDPIVVGEGFRFDPDDLLEAAKGQKFDRLCIIGDLGDGSMWVSGTANLGETFILMEKAKKHLLDT